MARFTRTQIILKMAEAGMIPVFYNSDAEICKQVFQLVTKGA